MRNALRDKASTNKDSDCSSTKGNMRELVGPTSPDCETGQRRLARLHLVYFYR